MRSEQSMANSDSEKILTYMINNIGYSNVVCAIVNEYYKTYDYVNKDSKYIEINKFSLYNMETNPLKHNNLIMHNFGMEITYNEGGALNHMELVKNFELDVESKDGKDGLVISQIQNGKKIIIKNPYDISDSARKINKNIKDHPVGFSGISYAKKKNLVKYTNPPEIIPIGCWCYICEKYGPHGHDKGCTFPNYSSLKLTLEGYVKCLFSSDKTYQSKLLDITDSSKKKISFKFMNEVLNNLDENFKINPNDNSKTLEDEDDIIDTQIIIDVKRLSSVLEYMDEKFFINIAYNISRSEYFIIEGEYGEKKEKMSEIFTDFNLEDIKTIPGLNKSGKIEYFPGTVILQYSLMERKTTIRFYDNFIHFITIPLISDYKEMILNVFNRFNKAVKNKYVPLNVTIEVAKGSFNVISQEYTDVDLNLNRLYNSFHPVDKNKNPINKNQFMYVKEYVTPDDNIKKVNFTEFENSKFEFTITPPENKRMTMTFVEYNMLSKPGYYKITAQIHSSGIIQLTFGYTKGSKEFIKLDNSLKYNQDEIIQVGKGIDNLLEYQTNFVSHLINYQIDKIVKKHFNTIKNLFYSKLSDIFDITPDIFVKIESKKKSSDMIYNIIPGIMPYRKKIFPHAGNVVDFFDDENPDYAENYGWSSSDADRGYIVEVIKNKNRESTFKIVKGYPKEMKILHIKQMDKNFIPDKLNICPIVETEEGPAYLLEEYDPDEKDKFWTLSVDNFTKEYEYKSFRIYRYSITGKFDKGDVQVCSKTIGEGIEMRPEPYSFYGKCPGGLNEMVNPIGLRSRKDNKFYPVCEKVKDRNQADKDIINFLLNGLTEEQLYEADIDPNIEFELHGEKLEDKYAGTFKPGTINRGNKIIFWDNDELNPKWLEGTIIDYKKDHGLGNDLNYVKFVIEVENDEQDQLLNTKKYEVYGEQFHPKYREKRNFEGLNKLIPNKEMQRNFIISCAKKLNLIKPSVQLMKENEKNTSKILKDISKMFKQPFDFSTCLRKIKPFVKNNIVELTKNFHLAIMIPSYGIRTLLYLENEYNQYIIDSEDNIMPVTIISSDDIPEKTLIEGYITENKSFYPIDIIFHKNKLIKNDYITYTNDGRLNLLQNIVSKFNTTLTYSNSIKVFAPLGRTNTNIDETETSQAYIGPTNDKTNLMKFVKNNLENNNMIFIDKNYGSNLLLWLNNIPHVKIVLQLIKRHEKRKHTWYMGLTDDNEVEHILMSIPISLDKNYKAGDYVKFKINMMGNALINENNPYIDITKSSEEYSKDLEDTINNINLVMYSVEKDIFMNQNKWEFSSIKKTYITGENFRHPLVELH